MTIFYILVKGIKIDSAVVTRGFILGIPNVFSSFFLLAALAQLAGIIVYPVTNIGIIILTSLLAMMIWKEQLNNYGVMALAMGLGAIVLLGF